jgi:hypothetical protein
VSLLAPLGCQFLRLFLLLMIVTVLRTNDYAFYRLSLPLQDLLDVLLMITLLAMCFGEEDLRGKISFSSHHYQGYILSI